MKCKHCGNEEYFYTKASYRGPGVIYYDSNGEYEEEIGLNGGMYDGLQMTEGKFYYCEKCDKRGARRVNEIDELLNQFS